MVDAITYLDLKTNITNLQEIIDFEMKYEINKHCYCSITGILKEEDEEFFVKHITAFSPIQIRTEKETPTVIFNGIIQKSEIRHIGSVYYLTLNCVSNSFKLDIKKKNRSFQDKNMTYKDIIDKIASDYSSSQILDFATESKKIENLILQYEETDWEFIKRLASRFNVGLIPLGADEGANIMFGIREGKNIGNVEEYKYILEKNIKNYLISKENYNENLSEIDSIRFKIETIENFDIYSKIKYQDFDLYISKKRAFLKDGILKFEYEICNKKGLTRDRFYNDKIVGLSIKGRVLKPIQDRIKVHLEIDENQDEETAWEFLYSTMYTAEGNIGWYCMPEINDTVYIYFPTKEESEAMGISSIRVGDKDTDKINNPNIKYFRTIDGKEIKFAPDEILITCINGKEKDTGEDRVVYIKMNQNTGIEIISTQPILLKSGKEIRIEAEEKIEIIANEEIKMNCKRSEIKLNSMIDIKGPEVRIN
ncbi:contractile injection system protein, VgrG/Pvc8 family [[Clostridium] colinum]|uniref:contractile injection system protein, VgrG/Pvc8 family n=1 Tax=[Clostridium] colinum TaxID=36835 RepID=UPI002024DB85|nr:contractile injection system protein, VgrG/Pvc8 family [[Clostridium] colinum]